jgi:hypothetical protein
VFCEICESLDARYSVGVDATLCGKCRDALQDATLQAIREWSPVDYDEVVRQCYIGMTDQAAKLRQMARAK